MLVHEVYTSGDEDEEEDNEVVGVAAIATTSTPSTSLFDAPNENTVNVEHKCLMAKGSEVNSSSKPITHISLMDDEESLKVKLELVGLDEFVSNLQGETKERFMALMSELEEAQELLEEQEGTIDMLSRNEREAANEIGVLNEALVDEQNLRVSFEKRVSSYDEDHNLAISTLTKERDHALAMVKVLKKEKIEFVAAHAKLQESHDQLQIQLTNKQSKSSLVQIVDLPSSSNPPCDDVNLVERRNKGQTGKEGLGYVPTQKKKNKKRSKKGKAAVQGQSAEISGQGRVSGV